MEFLRALAKLIGGIFSDIIHSPARLFHLIFGGRGKQASPQDAGAEARREEAIQEKHADDNLDLRAALEAFRRAVELRASGEEAKQNRHIGESVVGYVNELSEAEAKILASSSTNELRLLLSTGATPDGVRSVQDVVAAVKERDAEQVATPAALPEPAELKPGEHELRRAAIRHEVHQAMLDAIGVRRATEMMDDLEYEEDYNQALTT